MNAIKITGLRKTYGQVKALDGLDLEIPTGSVFGFLGPNGAGKTTTLRILAGLARQSGGEVELNGKPLIAFTGNQSIGYLPEEPAFYPWMSPLETLDYIGSIFHLNAKDRRTRAEELLELTGLKEVAKRRVGGFSRGMRQRLGLAQALVNHPAILLLDEPVSALDPIGRKEILEMISALGKECTVVMSTHILADVERVCDTIAILYQGKRILQSGREELLQHYATPALELEFNNGDAGNVENIEKELKQCPSVNGIKREEHILRLSVNDIAQAQVEVMKVILAAKLSFERFDIVKPSLEEIFVHLVGAEGGTK
jgi:ABC-2 type transport system ATP-binding protein